MYILYIYKINKLDNRIKNTIKRRFYYQLNKLTLGRTKKNFPNTFHTEEENEEIFDKFFKEYAGWIKVSKIKVNSFENIL